MKDIQGLISLAQISAVEIHAWGSRIDNLRNGRGATAIVPNSTRSRPGATVSAPLTWKELTPQIASDQFNLVNVQKRLQSLRKDPWTGIKDVRQNLAQPMKKLLSLKRP